MSRARAARTTALVAGALLLAIALPALGGCSPTLPSDPPGIVGTVTTLVAGDGRPASISVEDTLQPAGAVSDKAAVTIPPSTMFFDAGGGAASLAAISGIKRGTRVRVWFSGAIAESYPVQGSARAVQILGK